MECSRARPGEALFAASNSSLVYGPAGALIVTGGASGSRSQYNLQPDPHVPPGFVGGDIPLARSETAGAFSLATSACEAPTPAWRKWIGGVYSLAAAFSVDGGEHWAASKKPPHGYRSSVAYDKVSKLWIAVGPNGTDTSTDDGRTWQALLPDARIHEPVDANRNWNAISLPFVVPHGRTGKLRAHVLEP